MDNMNAVTLSVNGLDYRGWKKASISAGIERQSRDFTLGVTWRWPGQDVEIPVRQGDFCEVRIGEDLVLTGWVFSTPISYDSKTVDRSVSGRSLTADLVDSSAVNKPGQWRGQSVQKIVQSLAEPYGVSVTPDSSAVRRAVEAALIDLHNRESELGGVLLATHISEAISAATGEVDHKVLAPLGNVPAARNELLTYGGVNWV